MDAETLAGAAAKLAGVHRAGAPPLNGSPGLVPAIDAFRAFIAFHHPLGIVIGVMRQRLHRDEVARPHAERRFDHRAEIAPVHGSRADWQMMMPHGAIVADRQRVCRNGIRHFRLDPVRLFQKGLRNILGGDALCRRSAATKHIGAMLTLIGRRHLPILARRDAILLSKGAAERGGIVEAPLEEDVGDRLLDVERATQVEPAPLQSPHLHIMAETVVDRFEQLLQVARRDPMFGSDLLIIEIGVGEPHLDRLENPLEQRCPHPRRAAQRPRRCIIEQAGEQEFGERQLDRPQLFVGHIVAHVGE